MTKLLTVLIPTYNDYDLFLKVTRAYLKDKRVKILVSDDSDNYIEKKSIEIYCRNNNIKYYEGPRKSAGENWNFLLKKIDTPFFVLNHHDEYPSNLKFLDILEPTKTGLVILPCSSKIGDKSTNKMFSWQQKYFSKICILWPNATFNIILAPTASMVVNSKSSNVLFDENLKWFIDAEWYFRLFFKSIKEKSQIIYFANSRINSFQSGNSITKSLKGKLKEQINIERSYLNKKGLLPNKFCQFVQYLSLMIIISRSRIFKLINDLTRKILFEKR